MKTKSLSNTNRTAISSIPYNEHDLSMELPQSLSAINLESLDLQPGLTYEEHPIAILDRDERRVKRSMVKFVKVQWSNHSEDEATWEREDQLRQEYPEFFSDE